MDECVREVRGDGGVCEMCMYLALGVIICIL